MSPHLSAIGYWRSDESFIVYPHPKELVDLTWNHDERLAIAAYLKQGISLRGYFGYSYCRFQDGPTEEEMGTDDLTDGVWVWPQGLTHYVLRYSVRLPESFIYYAHQAQFRIPENLDLNELRKRRYSYLIWIKWVQQNRSNRLLALLSQVCLLLSRGKGACL